MIDIIIKGVTYSVPEDVESYIKALEEENRNSYKKELITPERASKILDELKQHPDHNQRGEKPSTIAKYANDMRNGNWIFCGDTIKFDVDGICDDGQQRLHAIVESGIPQEFIIVNNLPREAMRVIDSGFKKSVEDYLKSAKSAYETGASAVVRQVEVLKRGDKNQGQSITNLGLSNSDIIDLFDKDQHWYNKAAGYGREIAKASRALKKPEVGSIFYYLVRVKDIEEQTVRRYFSTLVNANADSGNGVYDVIKQELAQKTCKDARRNELLIKAWNTFVTFSRKKLPKGFKNNPWFIMPEEVEAEVRRIKDTKDVEFASAAM